MLQLRCCRGECEHAAIRIKARSVYPPFQQATIYLAGSLRDLTVQIAVGAGLSRRNHDKPQVLSSYTLHRGCYSSRHESRGQRVI